MIAPSRKAATESRRSGPRQIGIRCRCCSPESLITVELPMSIRTCVFTLASLAAALAMSAPPRADVRLIDSAQTLPRPSAGYAAWYAGVAIDGSYIIVLAHKEN